jgi:hypothetical protein
MTGKELFDAICTASERPRAPMPYIHVGDEYSRLDEDGMPIPISGYENVTIDALVDLEQAARLLTEQTQADLAALNGRWAQLREWLTDHSSGTTDSADTVRIVLAYMAAKEQA